MKNTLFSAALATGILLFGSGMAEAATPPVSATALCKDGTYYDGAAKRGACSHHNGVQQWLSAEAAQSPQQQVANVPAASPALNPAPQTVTPGRTVASSGGTDQVWVNLKSKVYHCANDKYYGKTKKGEFLPESQAIANGFHADHGKSCGQA